jgi:ribosomal protein S27AE
MKICPKCGAAMAQGVPHSDEIVEQWECDRCGYIEALIDREE